MSWLAGAWLLVLHEHVDDVVLVRAGKAGASQKTEEKVQSDKDAGLREGMLSLSSGVTASTKTPGSTASGRDCRSAGSPMKDARDAHSTSSS